MGQISMEIMGLPGSLLGGNQQLTSLSDFRGVAHLTGRLAAAATARERKENIAIIR